MRGKAWPWRYAERWIGITPAYAGKRPFQRYRSRHCQDHPRICGEKSSFFSTACSPRGSPPRMRGKGDFYVVTHTKVGITPAYAGKSSGSWGFRSSRKDHPRVCGEKDAIFCALCQRQGSPPRVRGKRLFQHGRFQRLGSPPHMRGKAGRAAIIKDITRITPAYAGKSVYKVVY